MRRFSIGLAVVGLLLSGGSATAYNPPFTVEKNVCPTCKGAKLDKVTLTTGQVLQGTVVGENPSFYVLVRFTEARAIPRMEVQGIEWANGSKPPSVTSSDQILLANGVVMSGAIVDDKTKPALFQLKSSFGEFTYVVFKNQVAEAYRSGVKVDI